MGVQVKDLLQLDIMKDFTVVVGGEALENDVSASGILDFEFSKGLTAVQNVFFDRSSIVLSSLLFAKDEPQSLYGAVEKLIEFGVSCLAYKPVIFRELPEEVIALAEKNRLCIIRFGGEEYFEDVLYAVMNECKGFDRVKQTEALIRKLIFEKNSPEQIQSAVMYLGDGFKDDLMVINLLPKEKDHSRITGEKQQRLLLNKPLSRRLREKCALCIFEDSTFLLISNDSREKPIFLATLQDLVYELGIDLKDYITGYGSIVDTCSAMDRALRSAYYARITAEIEGLDRMDYAQMGIYRLILENGDRESMSAYMESYFAPIRQENDGNANELLSTAVSYVLSEGDLDLTAQKLFCHRNTVRYRIAKLQEKLAPEKSGRDFFTELSVAVKIYLADRYRRS